MLANLLGLTRKYLVKCLDVHAERTGERYEIVKIGMPPIKYWLKNRKGDKWAKVRDTAGKEYWVRMGDRVGQESSLIGPDKT